MLASDEPPSAYLYVLQIPAPHLVIEQVPGQPGQLGHLIDRVSQPFASQVGSYLAELGYGWLRIHRRARSRHLGALHVIGRPGISATETPLSFPIPGNLVT